MDAMMVDSWANKMASQLVVMMVGWKDESSAARWVRRMAAKTVDLKAA